MDRSHAASDEQSLQLTQAALAEIEANPACVAAAFATLDHWDRVAPADTAPLRRLWREILASGDHARALGRDDLGQQLRQASPLAKIIPQATRLAIIRACKGRNSNT
jgi:hypothetical protein